MLKLKTMMMMMMTILTRMTMVTWILCRSTPVSTPATVPSASADAVDPVATPADQSLRRSTRVRNPVNRYDPHHAMISKPTSKSKSKSKDLSDRCYDTPTLAEAKTRADWPKWFAAIQTELDALDEMNVFEIVERPENSNILPGTWVLKRKRDENGTITKYKARLCVRGYRQVPDIDFSKTFAPTANATTVRLLLVHINLWIVQLDVKNAFATAHLNEDIVMSPPPYFSQQLPFNCVLKLLMSLYGLRQSANLFYQLLAKCLLDLDFRVSFADSCFYVFTYHDTIILAVTHVDDIFCATNNTEKLNQIFGVIASQMEITINWNPTSFIGLRLSRTEHGLVLDQSDYIEKILESFQMTDCNTKYVPMK